MLGIGELVVNVVSREIRERLVYREVERLVCWAAGNRHGEGEALPFSVDAAVQSIAERFREVNGAGTRPVQAEGSVSDFVEQIQVFNGRVVQAVGGADAALSGSAENFSQRSVAEAGRVCET